jgi:hypothetical protein
LGLEDHAFATTEGTVIHCAVAIVGECSEIMDLGAGEAGSERSRYYAMTQDALVGEGAEELREDGEDVELHKCRGYGLGCRVQSSF